MLEVRSMMLWMLTSDDRGQVDYDLIQGIVSWFGRPPAPSGGILYLSSFKRKICIIIFSHNHLFKSVFMYIRVCWIYRLNIHVWHMRPMLSDWDSLYVPIVEIEFLVCYLKVYIPLFIILVKVVKLTSLLKQIWPLRYWMVQNGEIGFQSFSFIIGAIYNWDRNYQNYTI